MTIETQKIQKPVYKICTKNCTQYGFYNSQGCKKGNWVFKAPLEKYCHFSVLEGQLEKFPLEFVRGSNETWISDNPNVN